MIFLPSLAVLEAVRLRNCVQLTVGASTSRSFVVEFLFSEARMAVSKTFFKFHCVSAEHSM